MQKLPEAPPLNGVAVLDLSRLLPGPFCSLILADLGANVLKVEDTAAGDYLRQMPPQRDGLGGAFAALNRGKRSLAIDLKKPEGRNILLKLLPAYRVVIESFRPGVMDRLGLSFADLVAINPNVILCSISGYGQTGPYAQRAGHDINFAALSGVLSASGDAAGNPALLGVQIGDIAGGALWAAVRILAALRSDAAAHLDVSMTEGAMSLLLPWYGDFAYGAPPLKRHTNALNGTMARYQVYRTRDRKHLAVGALEPKFAQSWSALLGAGVDETIASVAAAVSQKDRVEWETQLQSVDACVEPVLEMDELAHHPQHQARQMFVQQVNDPTVLPTMRLPLDHHQAIQAAPKQGQHTADVLREAGYSDVEVADFFANKIVR